jgi:hypothetical protein
MKNNSDEIGAFPNSSLKTVQASLEQEVSRLMPRRFRSCCMHPAEIVNHPG